MGKDSKIAWTDHTFNPWWGCSKVSEECLHCYADSFTTRYGHDVFGPNKPRRFFGEKHWREPLAWDAAAASAGERHKVFCASMGDLFEDRPDLDEPRARTFDLIFRTPHLDWLLCTKRPENLAAMLPDGWHRQPWQNVWLLATAGNADRFRERWGHLKMIPAVVRGISAEPLLGPLTSALHELRPAGAARPDWLIIGGESGFPGRPIGNGAGDPFDENAIDGQELGAIHGACQALGIAFFLKQLGSAFARHAHFRDRRAGADPSEWPEIMRVRQSPVPRIC